METTNRTIVSDEHVLKKLIQLGDIYKYANGGRLFYENQTPLGAYLVIKGEVFLTQGSKLKKSLGKGTLFGVKELVNHHCIAASAEVKEGSEICFLPLSIIREVLDKSNCDLSQLFSGLISTETTETTDSV